MYKKLLITILTSSDYNLFVRCYNSAKNQQEQTSFEVYIKIVINTLNDKYTKSVIDYCTKNNIDYIRTLSNGKPGKGHNSCLDVFKKSKCDFMLMVDGDDMLYPCAISQLSKFIKKQPDLDILHLMLNDKIHYENYDKYTCRNIKLKYKLISSFNENRNWWLYNKTTNPIEEKIYNAKTPSRLLFMSKNIFKTTTPIRYCEDMKLYDDMICFFSIYEAELKKELKTYVISENNIYLYNALNSSSASYIFKDRENEEKIFKQKVKIYKNAIRDNWQIRKLPFMKVDGPENFSIQNKIDFCIHNVVNYELKLQKINTLCLKKQNIDKLSNEEKNKYIHVLKKMIDSGINYPEHFILLLKLQMGINGDNDILFNLVKLFTINPSLIILKDILKIYQKYSMKDEQLEIVRLMKNYYGNTDCEVIMPDIFGKIKFKKNKELFCYYTGFTYDFNGSNYGKRNVYGSEIMAIKLCENLSEHYNCVVFCQTKEPIVFHNNVYYISTSLLNSFSYKFKIDHMVISRFVSFFMDYDISNMKNIYYIMHDARTHDMWNNTEIPKLGLPLFNNFLSKIKKIIYVSKWQKENFNNFIKKYKMIIDEEKQIVINNGLEIKNLNVRKIENSFLYCSNPNRGLDILCDIIVELQKKYSNVKLDIYFNYIPKEIETNYVNKYSFINYHGKVSNDMIKNKMSRTDFWVYPNLYSHETFCLSCLEAMNNKNVIITRDHSALTELVGNSGILIPSELKYNEVKKYTIEKISYILDNNLKKTYQQKSYQKSLNYDWKNISKQWIQLLNS
jgi:hypothetical protein